MINKLRRKFIIITMASVLCVLAIIMTAVNIINFNKVATFADSVLDVLYENDGRFPVKDGETPTPPDEPQKPFSPSHGMSEETPYETRYFSVRYDGGTVKADIRNIAAVTSEQAIALSEEVLASGKTRGYSGDYRYLAAEDGRLVIFIDWSRQIDTANAFLSASLIISGIGAAAVFVLVFLLSKPVVKPIAESYEKQKRFITDASHELKTPLTIISANAELIALTSGDTQATSAIEKQVARMTAMVKNLTALAKLDETEKSAVRSDFSLTDASTDMAEIFRPAIESGGRVFTDTIESGIKVNGDETLLRQAISVILENASKYAKTNVELTVKQCGKKAIVELSNDADYVKPGNLDMCFERFYRTNEARASAVSGNGLGLSIAKSIAELHGGSIRAEGKEGNIFVVTLVLPVVK